VSSPKSRFAGLRELLVLAWPVVISRATQSVVGFSDAVMVSPLGNDAIAATTTGALNVFSLLIFPMGLVFIVQSFAAQLHGKGDAAGARRYALYGLVVAALFELVALGVAPTRTLLSRFSPIPPRCAA
jgi:MATE family multidrug resistance protein